MISIIAAVAENGVIGGGNDLLWKISEDLKRFKAITMGHPVVMGRKTYESIGKPLPGRRNVIITRDPAYSAAGCVIAGSLDEAFSMFPSNEEVFVIGGGQVYALAMPFADRMYITKVHERYDGDTVFPYVDPDDWCEEIIEKFEFGAEYPHPFTFVNYYRR